MGKATRMTKQDASRIQSAAAINNGGRVERGSFAARAQSSADKSANSQSAGWPSTTENPSGGGRDNNPPKK